MKFLDTSDLVIDIAARSLKGGNLVAFPTETVFGIGADARNSNAVRKIYEIKKRPMNHPLIVHISTPTLVDYWASNVPSYAFELANQFWPGPLTLVLPLRDYQYSYFNGAQTSIAIRVPKHPIAIKLLSVFESMNGKGVVAPSANKFGKVSATSAFEVIDELGDTLGDEDVVLNYPSNEYIGIESTIVDCTGSKPKLIRPGFISMQRIQNLLGIEFNHSASLIRASGNFVSHYSPNTPIVLDENPQPGEGFFALKKYPTPEGVIRLGSPENEFSYAQNLYSALRMADKLKLKRAIFQTLENSNFAFAINDRLKKAAYNGMRNYNK